VPRWHWRWSLPSWRSDSLWLRLSHPADTLRRTPLFARHEQAGAKLVPFAGWEMPVQYEGIRQEHIAVRTAAGMFDVSHMGQIETSGPDAETFLQRVLSNDVTKIADRGAQYSVLCREDGGVLDDLFTYRLDDRFLTVTNAANHEKDLAWFRDQAGDFDVEIKDAHADWAMLAVQGPQARALLGDGLPPRMRTADVEISGVPALVCGALLDRGARPAGLGARDTLRLEVCFHLYGNDLSEDRDPIQAGLGWCCKLDTGFIGSDALREVEPVEALVPFAFTGPGIPRQGNPVNAPHGQGEVTSGSLSPCLETGVGMAYVPLEDREPGTEIEVDVRGKRRPAEVRRRPLYERKETSG
jgi:aminomethyltransferase